MLGVTIWLGDAEGMTDGDWLGVTVPVGDGDGVVVERAVSPGAAGLTVCAGGDDRCGLDVNVGTGSSSTTGTSRVGGCVVAGTVGLGVLSNGGTATLTAGPRVSAGVGIGVRLAAVVGVGLAGNGGPEGDATATSVSGPGMIDGPGPGPGRRMNASRSARRPSTTSRAAARRDHGNATG